ncbi:MAG TPA: DUF4232 domain-containing protein [Pyrinomonadaceae bacterium]
MRRTILLISLIIAVPSLAWSQTNSGYSHSESIITSRCMGSQLSASHESDDAGAGQRFVTYAFTNKSSSPCTLSGYPKFVLLNKYGRPIPGQSVTHNSDPVTVVTLAPGGKAFFVIRYSACSTVGTPPCRFSSKVRITAPHTGRAFILRERLDPFQLSVSLSPVNSSAP